MSELLIRARLIFWDFDGVIKESVAIKTNAFEQLFSPFGIDVADRVRAHHQANGGMSRFEKMPIYLRWAGQPVTDKNLEAYCQQFSKAVLELVITAPWVAGVERFLRTNRHGQEFILVTATPQGEIEEILQATNLHCCFVEVYGAPTRKGDAIRQAVSSRSLQPVECLMVGDALADLDAASENGVPFLLRMHDDNRHVFCAYDGEFVEDFVGL